MSALFAALLSGVAVALLVAVVLGRAPRLSRARRRAQVGRRQEWLTQAGLQLTPRRFALGSIAAGALAFTVLALLTGTPAVAIVPAVAIGLLPRAYYARRRAARLREVAEAWPDGLRDLIATISAGGSLHQAITALAATGPEPLQRAFSRYALLARALGVVPALEVVREELADPTSDRVIEVLMLAHERGGHVLTDILRDLADAATRDLRALDEIATDALEQQVNARAVFVLPWLVLLVLTMQPGPFRDFYRSPGGVLVVIIGAVMSLVGSWLVARLGRPVIEERVLGAAAPLGDPR